MKTYFCFSLFFFFASALPSGIQINVSSSMPRGVYRIVDAPLQLGSYVAVCLPLALARFSRTRGYLGSGLCPAESSLLFKQIIALPQMSVTRTAEGLSSQHIVFVNSIPRSQDSQGRKLPQPDFRNREGFWLLGTSASSWDSRYFGALTHQNLWYVVQPWWVW
jgi:conjugative transfer signal peptidase TraF